MTAIAPVDAHARSLLVAAGLDPALAAQPDADLLMALRLSAALGRGLGLDLQAEAALLHYLRRIDAIEHHLRAGHSAPVPHAPLPGRERPAPWHEPHG
ncbi:MAG: hypothetical protein ACXWKI_16195 [Ramlibacter sp.]